MRGDLFRPIKLWRCSHNNTFQTHSTCEFEMGILLFSWEAMKGFLSWNAILQTFTVGPDQQSQMPYSSDTKTDNTQSKEEGERPERQRKVQFSCRGEWRWRLFILIEKEECKVRLGLETHDIVYTSIQFVYSVGIGWFSECVDQLETFSFGCFPAFFLLSFEKHQLLVSYNTHKKNI